METYKGPERRKSTENPQNQLKQDAIGLAIRSIRQQIPINDLTMREKKGTTEYEILVRSALDVADKSFSTAMSNRAGILGFSKDYMKARCSIINAQYRDMQDQALEKVQVGDYVLDLFQNRATRVLKVAKKRRRIKLLLEDRCNGNFVVNDIDLPENPAKLMLYGVPKFDLMNFEVGQKVIKRYSCHGFAVGRIEYFDGKKIKVIVPHIDGCDVVSENLLTWRSMTELELNEYGSNPNYPGYKSSDEYINSKLPQ